MTVRFILDGEVVELVGVDPTATLLDHLRYKMCRTGTKEGCAEGDCGACTVLVGAPDVGKVKWRAVNACIQFLPMLHGKALITVESLKQDGALTPLQTCMAANGSSQCGFCTPGIVMSLHGRAIGASGSELPVEDVIAGNLCRCTGYGPILAAGAEVLDVFRDDSDMAVQLAEIGNQDTSGEWCGRHWFVPTSGEELATLLVEHTDARMVAGATDVGIWVTKGLKTLETLIFLGNVADLHVIKESDDGLMIGAGVSYADAHAAFARLHPDLGELVRRIGGLQVRNAATVGGNIANGSPIGDGPPALIALGAMLTLNGHLGRRTMPLEDFFLDYGKQDRRPWEYVESLFVPRPDPNAIVHISKLSRRFDSDISAVCGAFKLTIDAGIIKEGRIVFGGMAATPKRAEHCEAALVGQPFDEATIQAAGDALRGDFTPLTDVRGSSAYRLQAATNLLRRLWLREQGVAISVLDMKVVDG